MEYVNLGDVATYINGYAFKPEQRGKKGLPIIRIQDLNGNSHDLGFFDGEYPEQVEINTGDILISWSGSLGVYKWNKGKALLNQHIFKVLFNKVEIDKEYFCYAIRNSLSSMSQQTHGATMKHITKKDFDNISIPYPNLDEQKKIANNLNIVNKLIMFYEKELILFEQMVKARFIEMFGRPFINNMNWESRQIKNVVNEVKYGTSKPSVENGEYKYLRMNNLTYDGRFDLTDLKFISLDNDELEKCVVRKGDVLFNRTNSLDLIGKTADFDFDEDMVIAGYIIRIRLKETIVPKFFSMYMNTDEVKLHLRTIAKGAVNQANINAQELQGIPIYIPPIELQQQFADFVKQVDKSREEVKKSLEKTYQLYDSLMQEYFG